MAGYVAHHSRFVSALEGSKPSCYEGTMHDLLGMEGPDCSLCRHKRWTSAQENIILTAGIHVLQAPRAAEEALLPEREIEDEEPRAEEPRAEEPRAEEPRAEEPRAEEPRAEEPRAEEPRAEEPRAEEPRAEEPRAEELRAEEPRAEEPRAEELRAEEPRAEEPRAEEPRAEEPLPGPGTAIFQELRPVEEEEPFPATPSCSSSSAPPLLLLLVHSQVHGPTTVSDCRRSRRRQLGGGESLTLRPPSQAMCSSCGLRKIKETGHRNLVKASGDRVSYCPVLAQWKSPEEWLDSLQ
ncbi:hypothetical protein OYC64_003009 [Pagothenia borchgrevinki]|uniref:Uncharacterized protein n=1 Tax=Pagothenia borchgrevinki TaxID=8213 RepID=A0ABD2HA70_PAGBO